MQAGMVGLGRMGANMAARLVEAGHEVVGYDQAPDARKAAEAEGVRIVDSMEALVSALPPPRVVWVMVPAGEPTERAITTLGGLLEAGDVVVDGGNSPYGEARHRLEALAARGIGFLDAGTSGGIWGRTLGYCLMVGGASEHVARCAPLFEALAPEGGWAHVGPSGAGHFVKMVHNGIEYALMEAYAEGFELLDAASEFELDLHQVAALWCRGSVVRSWLLELAEQALRPTAGLERTAPRVAESGEGRWTVEEAVARGVPVPAIAASLFRRFESNASGGLALRLLAALRHLFGGHPVDLAGQ
jgi:6-phosphogluconate dehydrogenase